MSEGKELTFAGFAAMFRLGPEKITMTKADAVRLAELAQAASEEITRLRAAINDALTAPFPDPELNATRHQEPIGPNETPEEAIKRLVSVRAEWEVHKNNCENPVIAKLRAERLAEISARMKAEGEFSTMQRRIARQRRALAKLYQRRHDKNAALATARREGMKEAAKIAESEPELPGPMPAEFEKHSRETLARASCIATKRAIAAAIRAAAGEGK